MPEGPRRAVGTSAKRVMVRERSMKAGLLCICFHRRLPTGMADPSRSGPKTCTEHGSNSQANQIALYRPGSTGVGKDECLRGYTPGIAVNTGVHTFDRAQALKALIRHGSAAACFGTA